MFASLHIPGGKTLRIAQILTSVGIVVLSSQTVQADDPRSVGTVSGTFFYDPPDRGGVTGEEFDIGQNDNSVGSYVLRAGEENTVVSGTVGTARERAPRLGIGTGSGADGFLTVTGAGAVMRMLGDDSGSTMDIGTRGTGSVSITNGGRLEVLTPSNTDSSSSSSIQLGKSNGDGTLLVDNGTVVVSSPLDAFLFVGANQRDNPVPGGTASVSISNGSALNIVAMAPIVPPTDDDISEAGIVLGQVENSNNSMTVDASTVSVLAEAGYAGLSIAREANSSSTFVLQNGSIMSVDANTSGAVNARFSGALLQVGRDNGTNGSLRIESGAELNMTSNVDGSFVGIGRNEGAFGALTITTGGSLSYNNPANDGVMQVGQDDPTTSNGGVGLVTVTGSGSTLDFDGMIEVGNARGSGSSTGIMTVSNGGTVLADTIDVYDGGILKGSGGTINAAVSVTAGGLLAPGASPGTLDIIGDLSLGASSRLEIEFAGSSLGEFDVLNIFGDLVAEAPFSLTMSFLNNFMPEEGSIFNFLNVTGDIDGFFDFAEIDFLGIDSNFSPSFRNDGEGGIAVGFTRLAPVPLPMPAMLLLSGMGAFATLRRRRGRAIQ